MTDFDPDILQDDIISPELRSRLESIMAPDYKVYNHFKPIFEKKLESFGQDRMAQEIRDLRRVNEEVMKRCKFSEVDNAKLSGENKWWGTANLMGYLVRVL